MTYFWCEKHKRAEQLDEDTKECFLVGPFSTKAAAETFNAAVQNATPSTKATKP